jgi:hypothetical protein
MKKCMRLPAAKMTTPTASTSTKEAAPSHNYDLPCHICKKRIWTSLCMPAQTARRKIQHTNDIAAIRLSGYRTYVQQLPIHMHTHDDIPHGAIATDRHIAL